jgi:hypothetical protein
MNGHAAAAALDPDNRRFQPHLCAHRRRHTVDILPRPAIDGPPLVLAVERQETVVLEEPREGKRWKAPHLLARGRPDRPAHRQQVVARKPITEALVPDQSFNGHLRIALSDRQRGLVEHHDVADHAPEGRAQGVRTLRKRGIHGLAAVFHGAVVDGDRKGHVAFLRCHAEMSEETRQVGVVSVVEDNKPGVDGDRAILPGRLDGAGVTSKTVIRFIQDDIMAPRKQPGSAEPGNACTDDRNSQSFHETSLRPRSI